MKNMHTDLRVQKVNAVETRQSIHRIIRLLGSVVDFTYLLVNTTGQSTMALFFRNTFMHTSPSLTKVRL